MSQRHRNLKRYRRKRFVSWLPSQRIHDAIQFGKLCPPFINSVEEAKEKLAAMIKEQENNPFTGGMRLTWSKYYFHPVPKQHPGWTGRQTR